MVFDYLKNIFIFMIIGLFTVGIISSSAVFGGSIDSPRKQMAMGTAAEDVVCKAGYDLMLRSSGTAACVKPSTAMKLENSGWGTITKTAAIMEDEMMDDTMEDEMMDDAMEKMTIGGIDISMASPVEGNEDATITIIEFGDYQCVNCDKWFLNEKPTITNEFLDTGKAKMYFLDFPFQGPDSYTASESTWCANEQGKFTEYHDVLYVNQGGLEDGWASPESQKQFALDIELDIEQFNSCLDSGKFSEQVLYNKQVGISNGVDRTPVFFIVGPDDSIERIDGNQPASVFQKVINDFINNQ